MQYNVSQLLLEPTGSTRNFPVLQTAGEASDSPPFIAEAQGAETRGLVRMLRTHRGILVRASVEVSASLNCGRCLSDYRKAFQLEIEEEFLPLVDLATGAQLNRESEEDSFFRIGGDHVLDLNEAVRQYSIVDQPMKPLCREDCRGLCHHCGADLNFEPCSCEEPAIDPRWAALSGLAFPK